MKKKYKLSKRDTEVLLFWKKWYIFHGDNCPHPMMVSMENADMFSATFIKEQRLWNWSGGANFSIKFTNHFFDLIENYD